MISTVPIFDGDGRVRKDFERWKLYAAFIDAPDLITVKIGITQFPAERLYAVHCGSPFPLQLALWTYVGSKSTAFGLENDVHKAFRARRTRGEWFQFDSARSADKREFHDTLRGLYLARTGKLLRWQKYDLAHISEHVSVLFTPRRKHFRQQRRERSLDG